MTRTSRSCVSSRARRGLAAIVCAAMLAPGEALLLAQEASPPSAEKTTAEKTAKAESKLPPERLDALVSPIALYPDPLLAQVLVASTYPLEIVQLQQWLAKHKDLKDKKLTEAVSKEDWDPSIQGLAALPDVVKRLGDDIQWTTELGNAFLAQQGDVMDAVQRMRQKAKGTGALTTNEQQKVETKVVEQKQVIVIQQANPEVVYVPTYNPVVVYGPPVYAYPPIYYPPPPAPGAMLLSFGVGLAIGAAWGGGGWGYGSGWGGNDINVNVNNNFNRNTNVNRSGSGGGGGNWSHNPQHRGGTPYANQATANKFSGSARGGDSASRQASRDSSQASRQSSRASTDRTTGDRSADRSGGRSASPQASSASRGDRGSGGGGGDRIGNRDVSRSGGSGSASAMSGSRSSGSSARASSSRGSSSAGSRGGGSRGGGGGRRR